MKQFKHTHLWNDLPFEVRKRLYPYQTEAHILHLEQTKLVIARNYKRMLREINDHIKNLEQSLKEG